MKVKLTKWERQTLHDLFKSAPGGTLGQIEQDMRIMNKLELSDRDNMMVFLKDVYTEEEFGTLNNLLGKINLNLTMMLDIKSKVPDETAANTQTELTMDAKDVQRLVGFALQASGYPKHPRSLELKKRLDNLKSKI